MADKTCEHYQTTGNCTGRQNGSSNRNGNPKCDYDSFSQCPHYLTHDRGLALAVESYSRYQESGEN